MLISNMEAAVGAGATFDVRPPVGQAYLITRVGSDALFVGNVPEVQVAIRDAVLADAIVQIDPTTDPGKRTRPLELYLSRDNFMRITNTAAGGANLSWFGERVDPNLVITDLAAIGAGATITIQPPAGQTWRITEFGASVYDVVGDVNPDVSIGITNGTLAASLILDPNNVRGQDKKLDLIIDNDIYLTITDTSGAGLVLGYSGIIVPLVSIGSVQDLAGSGTLDIQPPATEEWEVTEIAVETWNGGGIPNQYPDVLVSMRTGVILSDILEAGSIATSLLWNQQMKLLITNASYLRIAEVSTANNEIGILGYLKRSFSN